MPKLPALFVVSALLPACMSNVVVLEPEAQSVKLVRESERPLRCKVLGKISGTSQAADEPSARTGAENDLRNQTAGLKGNFALVENENSGPVGTSSQHEYFVGGKALLCQTEEMEDADEKAAATAKAQKEKEDADREQKEKDEKAEQAKDKKKAKK
jgi:hypothetical protein